MKKTLLLALALIAVGCAEPERAPRNEGEWRAILYPASENLLESEVVGISGSLEQCRSIIQARASELNLIPSQYDYECGLNCEVEESASLRFIEALLRRNPEDSAFLAQKAQLEAYGMDPMWLCEETVK